MKQASLVSTPHVTALAFCALAAGLLSLTATPSRCQSTPTVVKKAETDAGPHLGVYRWSIGETGGPIGNAAFATWLGRSAVWGEDFMPIEGWENQMEGGGWQLGPWSDWKHAKPGRRFILSVPLLPGPWDRSGVKGTNTPVSLEAGAHGDYNVHFQKLAQNLVSRGLGDSILRLGWELNGGWYTWRAKDSPEAFAGYWRQIVTTMRAVPGAEKLTFDFNPAMGYQQFPADLAWPGDAYVDYVGLDVYDNSWASDTYPLPSDATAAEKEARQKKVWQDVVLHGDHGLAFWSDFAAKHHKPFSIPEWGVSNREDKHGGLDNPYFVEQMHKFITDPANNVYFDVYFDVQAGDGHHQLSPGVKENEVTEFPLSAARFRTLFGIKK